MCEATSDLPVLVGSGVTLENIKELSVMSCGVIVGSYFKVGGLWYNRVDEEKVIKFMETVCCEKTL